MHGAAIVLMAISIISAHPNHDCSKLFNPQNYMEQLPSLSLPYINNLAIPSPKIPLIRPSPVITTKVINVVTKYVSRSPVCIKVSGKKPPCGAKPASKAPPEYVITKEYFVNDRTPKKDQETQHLLKLKQQIESYKNTPVIHHRVNRSVQLQSSEGVQARAFSTTQTPALDKTDMLIEDRLDKLEDIIPHYKRMRVYETSTITVTKTRAFNKATATLTVKNCIPEGIDYCKPKKNKRRKSKIAGAFRRNGSDIFEHQNYDKDYI